MNIVLSGFADDLTKWGYTRRKTPEEGPDPTINAKARQWNIEGALSTLGLLHDGTAPTHSIWHKDDKKVDEKGKKIDPKDQTYTVDGRTYRVCMHFMPFSLC